MSKDELVALLASVWSRETSVDEAFGIIEDNVTFTDFPNEGNLNITFR
jgi:hypothetical protein